MHPGRRCPLQVHNNWGGGFVANGDKVALNSMKFASPESAGATCTSHATADGDGPAWLEASMEQVCVPLPPWAVRAGARETIYFNPKDVHVASKARALRLPVALVVPALLLRGCV